MQDSQRSTHFVYAKLWEPIQPIDRGERYEDPLAEVLEERELGEVTGGGTQFSADYEIIFAGIDIELVNLDEGLEATRVLLEQRGAPRGSVLEFQRDGIKETVSFGVVEAVAVYLDGISLPDNVYSSCDTNVLADQLIEVLGLDGGEIRGSWMGPEETAIYLYGANAEDLFTRIEPVLLAYPACQNARVVIRHGNPELGPRVVRMPIASQARVV